MKKILLATFFCLLAGPAIAAPFIDNEDGTVTDQATGLIWQQSSDATTYSWQAALDYCNESTLNGTGDWRLPNVKELYSIFDTGVAGNGLDPVFSGSTEVYWSSTTALSYATPDYAYYIKFDTGDNLIAVKTTELLVRCVR